jgi:hypothetical protein
MKTKAGPDWIVRVAGPVRLNWPEKDMEVVGARSKLDAIVMESDPLPAKDWEIDQFPALMFH